MQRDLPRFSKQSYDLLVIGGGINGAAIAHLAALRKMKVALVEKGDFAGGTSSKSSKLMHGGIRYLETFQFSLVREALRERHFHLEAAPHLVKPLPFIVPVYEEDRRPLWKMKVGVWLYDLLAGRFRAGKHEFLDSAALLQAAPGLKREGLRGGVLYYDAQMDDVRVCLENVLAADAHGAHVANYTEVTGFLKQNGRVAGVRVRDTLDPSQPPVEIRARHVFAACGAWTNALLKIDEPKAEPRVRPTKGVHLVIPKKISDRAFLIPAKRDNRVFFILPWRNNTMIGTTDTDYDGDPDDVKVEESDIAYLLEETRRVFPGFRVDRRDITASFAGLRPLIRKTGQASSIPREHEIFQTMSGLWCVVGGKYTTYRVIAEDCVDRLQPNSLVRIQSLYGSGPLPQHPDELAREYGVSSEVLQALMAFYGSRFRDILDLVRREPSLGEPAAVGLPLIRAQFVYACRQEMARTPEDILYRRLSLGYSPLEMDRHREALEQAARAAFKS